MCKGCPIELTKMMTGKEVEEGGWVNRVKSCTGAMSTLFSHSQREYHCQILDPKGCTYTGLLDLALIQ